MTAAAKFGRRLRTVRKAHKLNIGLLAERANTGVKHLGRIERGEKQPSFELIIALAQAMSVSPSTFFEFDPPQTDPKALRRQLDQLLENRGAGELLRAYRALKAFFES